MFKKYDTNQSGYIEYSEFKKIWVRMANVKKELTDRGVKIPKVATNGMLITMLEQILDAEEDRYGWKQHVLEPAARSRGELLPRSSPRRCM